MDHRLEKLLVSIQHLLLFITCSQQINRLACSCFNTTLVIVHPAAKKRINYIFEFQYNTCYCSSLWNMLGRYFKIGFNTTLVIVHQNYRHAYKTIKSCFNTTLVIVHRQRFRYKLAGLCKVSIQHLLLFIAYIEYYRTR